MKYFILFICLLPSTTAWFFGKQPETHSKFATYLPHICQKIIYSGRNRDESLFVKRVPGPGQNGFREMMARRSNLEDFYNLIDH